MKRGALIEPAIETRGLSKRYGRVPKLSLDSLSIQVMPGEVYGFLGPNGAGKSTAIRLLMNFIQPTSGSASILGKDIVNESVAIKSSVGYLSGDNAVYPKMTGKEYLAYLGALQGALDHTYVTSLVRRFRADLNKPMVQLSRGNRQKIGIIQAFMHAPKVCILDEPTSGLDPLMQEEFYELVRETKARGAAIFMSSHVMAEVQKVCDRVGIVREGKLIAERSMVELSRDAAQTFDITFVSRVPLAGLAKIKGVTVMAATDSKVTIRMTGKLSPLFAFLAGKEVVAIDARSLDLEEVFIQFYRPTRKES